MKNFLSRVTFIFYFCFLTLNTFSQQTVQKIITETNYLLYLPNSYKNDTSKRWPLLIFLHGSGESGNDINKVKTHGPPRLIEEGKQFPFIVVSPQSDVPSGWDVDQLYKLLQQVKKNYRVDQERIYLTGLSMGGYGTWELAIKHPEEFAALAPICGGGDTSGTWRIRNIPVWGFHGKLDKSVPLFRGENMVKATSRWNRNVRFTVYPNKEHNSWDTAYNTNDSLYDWLLTHKKFRYTEVPVSNAVLQKYHGTYIGQDRDTVKIITRNNELIAITPDGEVVLKPGGVDMFYLNPDKPMDIRFISEKNGISSFIFFGDRKLLYGKVRGR
ncbi:MAG TPA: prolyl oligopeptidase family serine peptidase [Chitinophagaceae bacterium]